MHSDHVQRALTNMRLNHKIQISITWPWSTLNSESSRRTVGENGSAPEPPAYTRVSARRSRAVVVRGRSFSCGWPWRPIAARGRGADDVFQPLFQPLPTLWDSRMTATGSLGGRKILLKVNGIGHLADGRESAGRDRRQGIIPNSGASRSTTAPASVGSTHTALTTRPVARQWASGLLRGSGRRRESLSWRCNCVALFANCYLI